MRLKPSGCCFGGFKELPYTALMSWSRKNGVRGKVVGQRFIIRIGDALRTHWLQFHNQRKSGEGGGDLLCLS